MQYELPVHNRGGTGGVGKSELSELVGTSVYQSRPLEGAPSPQPPFPPSPPRAVVFFVGRPHYDDVTST